MLDPKGLRRTIVIENVAPAVDGGRHPIKREVGGTVEVSADVDEFPKDLAKYREELNGRSMLVRTPAMAAKWTTCRTFSSTSTRLMAGGSQMDSSTIFTRGLSANVATLARLRAGS